MDLGAAAGVLAWILCFAVCLTDYFGLANPPSTAPVAQTLGEIPPWRPDRIGGVGSDAPRQIAIFTAVFIVAQLVLKRIYKDSNTSFFLKHTIVNAVIVVLVFDEFRATVRAPLLSMTTPYSLAPTYIQIALHVAHMIVECRKLDIIDWCHHLLSSVLVGTLNVYYTVGPLLGFGIFFATGLPGGIDYLLLFMVKRRLIAPNTEKRINRILNVCIRMPGLMLWMGYGHVCHSSRYVASDWRAHKPSSSHEMPLAVLALMWLLIAGNGLFFCDRVIWNYAQKVRDTDLDRKAKASKADTTAPGQSKGKTQ